MKEISEIINEIRNKNPHWVEYNKTQASPIDRYIDFGGICEDYNLTSGDITPSQTIELERIIKEFIKQNK